MSVRLSVLALLALVGTVACNDTPQLPVQATSALADSADQVMFGVRFRLASEGLNQARLLADTGFFFEDNTRAEFRDVELTFYNERGAENATLTSREGTYNTRQSLMEARGNVLVVGEDGRRLTTEQLRYDQRADEISSDSAFVLTEPNGRRLEGVGFVSDPKMTRMRCLRACSGIGGAVTVPTQ